MEGSDDINIDLTRKRAFLGRRKTRDQVKEYGSKAKLSKNDFTCSFCKKSFDRNSALEVHSRTHTGIKPFKCEFAGCDKAFRRKEHLQNHSCSHLNLRRFACLWENCGKVFIKASDVDRHTRSQHLTTKYSCKYCDQESFKKLVDLRRHHEAVHNRPAFQCDKGVSNF